MFIIIDSGRSGYKMTTARAFATLQDLYNAVVMIRQKKLEDTVRRLHDPNVSEYSRTYLQEALPTKLAESLRDYLDLCGSSSFDGTLFELRENPTTDDEWTARPRKLSGDDLIERFEEAGFDLTVRATPPGMNQ